ncbi:MAG: hypothetical protein SFT90_02845 [Rickettsiales bacterium]|nr:hypothetical protein [Rickettsiales bacterium]
MHIFELNLNNAFNDLEYIKKLYPEVFSAKLLIDDVDKKSAAENSIKKILLAQKYLESFNPPSSIDIDKIADESNI